MAKRLPPTLTVLLIGVGIIAALGLYRAHRSGYLPSRLRARRAAEWARLHATFNAFRPDATLCQRQEWTPDYFFRDPEAIRACEAIAARDEQRLQAMIEEGLDVNLSGKAGFTLLHWAFVNDNLAAFQQLLESGASPDKKLTRCICIHNSTPLVEDDSLPFTVLRKMSKPEQRAFFFAAADYCREPNARDLSGNTLLHVAILDLGSPDIIARIVEMGVDLDAKTEHGDTAALLATSFDRPGMALQILQAGADPTIPNIRGEGVASFLERKMDSEGITGRTFLPAASAGQLRQWLKNNQADDKAANP